MICGVMEHIEEAGVHSGDSACAIPPYSLPDETIDRLDRALQAACRGVEGARADERAVCDRPARHGQRSTHEIFVLEVNPRAIAHRAVRQ
jgi:carbamoyl-phosphate synthase large subunit